MFKLLFILFISVPLVELYFLIKVGGLIGGLPTIILCLLTAAIGAGLLRHQGLQTLAQIQRKLEQGEVPATDLISGAILLLSGALLLTPGFVTDIVGFLCLTPPVRLYVAAAVLNHLLKKGARVDVNQSVIVEGEFWEENPKRLNK